MIPPEIQYFNCFDIFALLITCAFMFFGYIRGLVKEVLSLVSWGVSFFITYLLYSYANDILTPYVSQPIVRKFLSVLLPFVLSITFFLLLTSIISEKVAETKFKSVNKPLGGIFGFLKAAIILCIAFFMLIVFDKNETFKVMHNAKISSIFKDISFDALKYIKENKNDLQLFFEDLFGKMPVIQSEKSKEEEALFLANPSISETVYKKNGKTRHDENKPLLEKMRGKQRDFLKFITGEDDKSGTGEHDTAKESNTNKSKSSMKEQNKKRLIKALINDLSVLE